MSTSKDPCSHPSNIVDMVRPRVSKKETRTLVSRTTRTLLGLVEELERLLFGQVILGSRGAYRLETPPAFLGFALVT